MFEDRIERKFYRVSQNLIANDLVQIPAGKSCEFRSVTYVRKDILSKIQGVKVHKLK